MDRPVVGAATHGQADCRGRRSAVGLPQGATVNGQPARASHQWPARKGLSPEASPTVSRGSACRGSSRGGATHRSDAGRRGGGPLAKRLLAGKGSRR
ncbi:hypothetical protein BHM03_00054462, partial [Ensete ventricosum]